MRALLFAVLSTYVVAFTPQTFTPTRTARVPIGMLFQWRTNDTHIQLSVTAPTPDGYVGFGVGEGPLGSMAGADLAIAFFDGTTPVVKDYYATRNGSPILDCADGQDWRLLAAATNATHQGFEMERALTVQNSQQDRPIVRLPPTVSAGSFDPTKVLFAYGALTDSLAPVYHGAARYQANLHLFETPTQAATRSAGAGAVLAARGLGFASYDVAVGNHTIPAQTTEYHMTPCVTGPNPAGGWAEASNGSIAFVVGFEVLVDPALARYVHHLVLKAWTSETACASYDFMQMSDVWAIASMHDMYVFPDGAGIPAD